MQELICHSHEGGNPLIDNYRKLDARFREHDNLTNSILNKFKLIQNNWIQNEFLYKIFEFPCLTLTFSC